MQSERRSLKPNFEKIKKTKVVLLTRVCSHEKQSVEKSSSNHFGCSVNLLYGIGLYLVRYKVGLLKRQSIV